MHKYLWAALAAGTAIIAPPTLAQPRPLIAGAGIVPDSECWEMTAANGRRYQIFVARPSVPPPPEGYAIIYTLDANFMFGTMAETTRALQRRPRFHDAAIVVGIGYPAGVNINQERAFDLTPRLGSPDPELPGTGSAEAFMRFLSEELKPDIAKRFRINPARETLFGHSFGGLFVLYELINHPEAFDNYVAASPSIGFENRLLAKANVRNRIGPKLAATGATPRVLITVGEYEQAADPDFPNPRAQHLIEKRRQIDNAQEFAKFLDAQKGLKVKFELLSGEDHGTVIPVAISRAVRFAMSPEIVSPTPAPRHVAGATRIKVPDAAAYKAMTPEARYALRMRTRKLPKLERDAWVAEFDHSLSAGLTYGEHRALAEERVAMDKTHGTKPPE